MYKSCSRCGKIHEFGKPCPKYIKRLDKIHKFRQTNEWHKKSQEIMKKSKYLCSVCKDNGIYTYDNLEVHHIEPLKKNFERRLDNYNLICLCSQCHHFAEIGKIDAKYLKLLAEAREQ